MLFSSAADPAAIDSARASFTLLAGALATLVVFGFVAARRLSGGAAVWAWGGVAFVLSQAARLPLLTLINALVIGAVAGLVCYWGVNGLKRMLGADDSLDVFGVHGLGGATGAILTGVFAAPSLGGSGIFDYVANKAGDTYSIWDQVVIQATGCLTTVIWSGVVAFIAFKLVDLTVGLRVNEEAEREGLDISSHGETAYHG